MTAGKDNGPKDVAEADLDQVYGGGYAFGKPMPIILDEPAGGSAKKKPREIVVVGSKIKEVVRSR